MFAMRGLRSQSGFSLAELMVGLAIGLLATTIIIQVLSVFDAQRRSTTGSADAQTNGALALQSIVRDAQLAGYPLYPSADSPLECTSMTSVMPSGGVALSINPVSLTNGTAGAGVAASDSIIIRYGDAPAGGGQTQIGGFVNSPSTTGASPTFSTVVNVGSSVGCSVSDVFMLNNGPTCAMGTISAKVVSPASLTVQTSTSPSSMLPSNPVVVGANVACLGSWREITYAVDQTTLGREFTLTRTVTTNGAAGATTPILSGIVNIQAQYGVSASTNSNQIAQWVDATAGSPWAAPSTTDRKRIKALRVSVVARNDTMEVNAQTSSICSSYTTANPTGLCAWEGTSGSPAPTIDLSPANANWGRYRYRVFDTIIPLRNVLWAKDTL